MRGHRADGHGRRSSAIVAVIPTGWHGVESSPVERVQLRIADPAKNAGCIEEADAQTVERFYSGRPP